MIITITIDVKDEVQALNLATEIKGIIQENEHVDDYDIEVDGKVGEHRN